MYVRLNNKNIQHLVIWETVFHTWDVFGVDENFKRHKLTHKWFFMQAIDYCEQLVHGTQTEIKIMTR